MTVKQADAINTRYKTMKAEIDSLRDALSTIKTKKGTDTTVTKLWDIANGPSFVYNYKNQIYAIDLSLYKIKLTNLGKVVMKKMTKREIGKYFELLYGGVTNMVDWKQEFREFELPMIDSNKKLSPYLIKPLPVTNTTEYVP